MAVYLKAVKFMETPDKVVYRYGGHPEKLVGQFTIAKDLSNWKLEKDAGIPISSLIRLQIEIYVKTVKRLENETKQNFKERLWSDFHSRFFFSPLNTFFPRKSIFKRLTGMV